jgi:hypothetical protein
MNCFFHAAWVKRCGELGGPLVECDVVGGGLGRTFACV